jgi:hypothetical protein
MSPLRDLRGLKAASRLVVEAVGGYEAASAALGGYSTGRLAEACSPHHPDRWLRLQHVALLEALAEDPRITAELARLAGQVLRPRAPAAGCATQQMHQAVAEMGATIAVWGQALADGRMDAAERAALDRQLGDLERRVAAARGALRQAEDDA